ncbi:hypothetical protein G8D25_13365 [Ralstonia solanacearum]|uniref:hypothetical protein n=1 Tax=Ralstonia solanacearum TaxID=305 RepID=UPI00144A229D|nr:hypothetical protein [Ralstonia solanacearum]QJC25114.1 hypothetical protein G8D25_13365 [Ralstonia solanacearum]
MSVDAGPVTALSRRVHRHDGKVGELVAPMAIPHREAIRCLLMPGYRQMLQTALIAEKTRECQKSRQPVCSPQSNGMAESVSDEALLKTLQTTSSMKRARAGQEDFIEKQT